MRNRLIFLASFLVHSILFCKFQPRNNNFTITVQDSCEFQYFLVIQKAENGVICDISSKKKKKYKEIFKRLFW